MEQITLESMMETLMQVDDNSWGMYAFSRDILRDKVDTATKKEMIAQAIRCGYEKADEVISRFGTGNPEQIAEELGLHVEYINQGQVADRVLFALFTPPDKIQIMGEPIQKATENQSIANLISEEQMKNLILGHELFHFLEEEDETIYTRTEKIALWKLFGYTNNSTIRALSEIAGMYFTKRLNALQWSPFALDVILYYNYNMNEARKIYDDVISFR